jgi:hypothetical protein
LSLAKVGVEGSNPFARSKFHQRSQIVKTGPVGLRLIRVLLGACILSGFYATGRKLSDKTSQARRPIVAQADRIGDLQNCL